MSSGMWHAPTHRISPGLSDSGTQNGNEKAAEDQNVCTGSFLLEDYHICFNQTQLLQGVLASEQRGFEISTRFTKKAPQTLCGVLLQLRWYSAPNIEQLIKYRSEVGQKLLKTSGKNRQ